MADKVKVLEDLATLTKMCRSKSDGATLKVEEEEINTKIADLKSEIEDVKLTSEEDSYDTSAEMADRNIEIITKKVIQTQKSELKVHNQEMEELKSLEEEKSNNLNNSKRTKKSYETYISSMQDRITTTTDNEIINRYNTLIGTTEDKIKKLEEDINKSEEEYKEVQDQISALSTTIKNTEEAINKKKEQLKEAQKNLENKDVYIDKTKKERTDKKIKELEDRINKHTKRLEEIHNDPKYLEAKIKDVLSSNTDNFNARSYIIKLINMSSKQPYMNVDIDNALEEELLRATQARDTFANEMDQKTYDVMETVNPEQIRIEYLNKRISKWQEELDKIEQEIALIDKDEQFNYEEKLNSLDEMIETMRNEVVDYQKAYEEEPESNLSAKATLKVALDEKRSDLDAAIEIASKFRQEEADDIAYASHLIKTETEELKAKIEQANKEIEQIKSRLMSKKSGMKDIGSQNRDKEKLKELAKVVIDIKHRRQFPEKPIEIAKRLETNLGLDLVAAAFSNDVPTEEVENKAEEEITEAKVSTIDDLQPEEPEVQAVEETPEENAQPVEQTPVSSDEESGNTTSTPELAV